MLSLGYVRIVPKGRFLVQRLPAHRSRTEACKSQGLQDRPAQEAVTHQRESQKTAHDLGGDDQELQAGPLG